MVFEIIFSPKAIRQMKKLERETQVRIKSAIERSLRSFPPEGDVVKLERQRDVFRLRVGDWRVTFRYRFDKREVHISEVVHRSKAYQSKIILCKIILSRGNSMIGESQAVLAAPLAGRFPFGR
ncbi:MAG: type II toxin-antitoxin system RelE/ParE family toxin [Thermoanaerobacteraceae bacterium]|nr:type II toxin-antitoxin system RelE/ParE family toxin [Thermoanaerobacteraceae bacterium]